MCVNKNQVLSVGTALFVTLLIGLILPMTSARAQTFGAFSAIVCDPLKLGAASQTIIDSIDRINTLLSKLSSVEGQANVDLKERIAQVQALVNTLSADIDNKLLGIKALVEGIEKTITDLEKKIFSDAADLMQKATCAVEQATNDQLQRSFAQLLSSIRQSDAHLQLPGFRVASVKLNEIKLEDPNIAYVTTRDKYLDQLSYLNEADAAYAIESTYENIARFARFARCSYPKEGPVFAGLIFEELFYEQKAAPWASINPEMMK